MKHAAYVGCDLKRAILIRTLECDLPILSSLMIKLNGYA